ncbi:MAG: hypothetical protein MJ051_05200 [Akkermansia sp.]|nr:hypothetical protein [Akkermansia sp.]
MIDNHYHPMLMLGKGGFVEEVGSWRLEVGSVEIRTADAAGRDATQSASNRLN